MKAVLLLVFFSLLSLKRHNEPVIEKIEQSLMHWSAFHPQEKVYLHMDKPYYALGDTIWFKAYITTGSRNQLSAMSGALYAELISEKGTIAQTLKLPLIAGQAMGDFTLADTLTEGNYRIRAYTQWMRNAGDEYFFDRTISVGNAIDYQVQARVDYSYENEGKQPVLNARISYRDESGNAIEGKTVKYKIISGKNEIASKSEKTDAGGQLNIRIADGKKTTMQGAYIEATISLDNKQEITKTFPVKAALSESDVQFFPEGGHLVAGITSRMGFKAIGIDGLGLNIKGDIKDDQTNETISGFETSHAGMGSFNFRPEAGKSYTATITYPDGSSAQIPLPKGGNSGYALAVYQTGGDSILVRIHASTDLYQAPTGVNLVVQSGGELLYAGEVKIAKAQTSILLSKQDYPSGIAQFTLFDNKGEPMNERIAFINNADRMQLSIQSEKQTYKPREKVSVSLNAKDKDGKATAGSFSVAVIDESKVPFPEEQESTILSNILLTADLKGYIEKPNWYFVNTDAAKEKALDQLMLTQGYRRFVWKNILQTDNNSKPEFPAEKVTTDISGTLKDLTGKPIAKGKVTLLSIRGGVMRDTTTDNDGRFSFGGILLTDSIKFTVQGRTLKDGKKVEVVLDTLPKILLSKNKNLGDINTDIATTTKTYLDNSRKEMELLEKSGKINRMQYLKEVKIRDRWGRNDNPEMTLQGMYKIPEGHADQTYVLEEAQKGMTLGIALQGRLHGVIFKEVYNPKEGLIIHHRPYDLRGGIMAVIVDGSKVRDESEVGNIFDGNSINPEDILKIEVIRTNIALMNMVGGSAIFIYTKRNRTPRYNPSVANIDPKGFNQSREFYSPKYERSKKVDDEPDFRSTVYWNPGIKTTTSGELKFDFFNSDNTGQYKVIVEGINGAGELGRQVYKYQVQ